jgi:hypothetical protein
MNSNPRTPSPSAGRRKGVGLVLTLSVIAAVASAVWYFSRPEPVPVLLQKVDRGHVEASVAKIGRAHV